ncbi:DUF6427 family protein [Mucilaginibacter myungsuensis]|uniref:Beta-carotene 15,15'-monooxygenase n=1 Tax=Mucilaginibacter myungsuensis TaxID=649104 RepID=A0A929KTU4_9SPHI|nr:DUF6427 family protein [Mucilaginibacter myungsuensis]MBE9661451.1 beta-carotene 15,15'-monooxygenase [Mucilaginibacter myungsuensis]MDN3597594.1 DUF6427 family protein [Mucilaginibacter myungsuensis]
MIKAFRNYNPVNIIWLAVLLVVLRICYLFNTPDDVEFKMLEPFARSLVPLKYEHAVSLPVNMAVAGILVLIQAILLNYVVNFYNLLSKPSFLPALMYVVVSGLFTPFLTLSAPLICNFLVIWIVYKLLAFYKGTEVRSISYDLGMLVALSSLFYLPCIYFFVVIWAALLIFRPFDWRDWAASILGYLTVFFFLAVIYYLTDRIHTFYKIWLPLGTPFPEKISIHYLQYALLVPVAVILLLCLVQLRGNFFKSYVLIRKSFQLFLIMFLIGGLSFYVKVKFNLDHFLLCAVPVAIFFAYYFLYAAKRWFYESLFILLLAGIIFFQFNTF